MPDIEVTDQLGKEVDTVKVDLSHPSSLLKYLKSELLHVAVVPDFLQCKDLPISQAAPKAISFDAKASHGFELGGKNPDIQFAPGAEVKIRANTAAKANLCEDDPFRLPVEIKPGTGYVGVAFTGSLGFGMSANTGDLTFGFEQNSSVTLEFLKAFPLGTGEPSLGAALGETLSSFTIPSGLSDLDALQIGDIATASGEGSLAISGMVQVSASPNPLASVDLPLGVGSIAIKAGSTAALKAEFTISGSYQIRALRKTANSIQLSVSKEKGTKLEAGVSASAGLSAKLDDTDLLAQLIELISTDPTKDHQALADLSGPEREKLCKAIESGLNHSLKASLDVTLSALADNQAAFQYEIQSDKLTPQGQAAVQRALKGDFSLLTAMEDQIQPGGTLAPGITMLNSVLTETRKRAITFKVNLLGILNYISLSELIRNSEIYTDDTSGDVTIKETASGNSISALSDPLDRAEALRKVLFNSVLATTSYRAGKAVTLPSFTCDQLHFAFTQTTNPQTIHRYCNGFVALRLLTQTEEQALLPQFRSANGRSTCVLRTSFGDAESETMFFDSVGNSYSEQHYLEIGRQALRALLADSENPNDVMRYKLLDDSLWPKALSLGSVSALASLVGLRADDPRVVYLTGDVGDVKTWAQSMIATGALIRQMRTFVGSLDPAKASTDPEFKKRRDALQKQLAASVKASKARFDLPWGMVCLYWAAGSPATAYGKATTTTITIEKGARPKLATAAG